MGGRTKAFWCDWCGPAPALSVYFKALLEVGKLNAFEAVELARIVLQKPGGAQYIQKLIGEDKLEEGEELGDAAGPREG